MNSVCRSTSPIVLACAADDDYALPLAVTIRSAIDSTPTCQSFRVFVLDGGLTARSKRRLVKSWRSRAVTVEFLRPDLSPLANLRTENHLNCVAYARLLLPALIPKGIEKLIYLDADLVVLHNLAELWSIDLEDAPLAAVHDYFVPYFNTPEVVRRPTLCDEHSELCLPIRNYRELGLAATSPYFNSGVMVVNLAAWRESSVTGRAIEILRANAEHVRLCDQYALNVLFANQWKQVDLRWNQNCDLSYWSDEESFALGAELYRLVRDDPWILHFSWTSKPWHLGCKHPHTPKFFEFVDRTVWRGWRPRPSLRQRAAAAWDQTLQLYEDYRRWRRSRLSPAIRTWKQRLFGPRRKAA